VCGFEPSVVRVFQPQRSRQNQPFFGQAALHRVMSLVTHALAGLRTISH
jgi:hypothetical protein